MRLSSYLRTSSQHVKAAYCTDEFLVIHSDGLPQADQLVCDSYPRDSGDVSLWFSLRFTEALDANATSPWIEPNLMDSGFTFMYYPPPENFSNSFVTGGPLQGGTDVVIEGGGFTKGYRNESDIDISSVRNAARRRRPPPPPPAAAPPAAGPAYA